MSDEMHAALKANLDKKAEELVDQYKATAHPELGEPTWFWDIVALGPFMTRPGPWPGPLPPGDRIIQVGQRAFIGVVVFLNPIFPTPQSACDIINGFGAKIELNMVTSNMQTMTAAPLGSGLSRSVCIETSVTAPQTCTYTYVFDLTPQAPACLYETNICAKICNCNDFYVPQYAAFARWVTGNAFGDFWGSPFATFDHPIRYMVADLTGKCCE